MCDGARYGAEHRIVRAAEDQGDAEARAGGLAEIAGVAQDPGESVVEIVLFDVSERASAVLGRLLEQGVRVSQPGPHRLRAVTHLDISRQDVEEALQVARRCFS